MYVLLSEMRWLMFSWKVWGDEDRGMYMLTRFMFSLCILIVVDCSCSVLVGSVGRAAVL